MGVYIINEWLWSDIRGENEKLGPRQSEAALFLGGFIHSPHQMVLVLESKFEKKAFDACKSNNQDVKLLAKHFLAIRLDLDRCKWFRIGELEKLPKNLEKSVKDDDHYLVRALLTVPDSVIVTTDRKLCEAIEKAGYAQRCITRSEFLKELFDIPTNE